MNKVFYEYQAKHHELCKPFINYIQKDSAIEIYGLTRLIDNLLLCAMLHKHPSFSAEQEVRISPPFVKDADPNVQYKALDTIKKVYVLDLNKLCKREEICFEELIDSIVIGLDPSKVSVPYRDIVHNWGFPRFLKKSANQIVRWDRHINDFENLYEKDYKNLLFSYLGW